MLGRGVQDSAQAIAKKFNTTANRAATLVYTESAPARGNDRAPARGNDRAAFPPELQKRDRAVLQRRV